jgi:subtilisin family serine protease
LKTGLFFYFPNVYLVSLNQLTMKKLPLFFGLCLCFSLSFAQSNANYDLLFSSGTVHPAPNWQNDKMPVFEVSEKFEGFAFRYIQFYELPTEAEKETLKSAGIDLLLYIPNYTYVASVKSGTDLNVLAGLKVRGFYAITPEYKMLNELSNAIGEDDFPDYARDGSGNIGITFTYYPGLSHDGVLSYLASNGYRVTYHNSYGGIITAWVKREKINDFVGLPFVCAAELKDDISTPENNVGRTSHRDNYVATDYSGGRKYNGTGVKVMLQDDGIIGPHIDYQGRLIQQYITFNNGNHGDHCAGTIMGGGNRDPLTRGMAWGAQIFVYEAAPSYQGFDSVPSHYANIGIRITSTSYSNGCNAGYTTLAQMLDQQNWNMPSLMHVFSAGNSGTSNCNYGAGAGWGNVTGGHKHGKNSIAVANLDYLDVRNNSSSKGPAHDGRLKPEVSAVGTTVYSTIDPNAYENKTGTSMSCPGVAGTFAQMFHAYRTLNSNNDPPSGLIKAYIMNTCDDLGNPGPDFSHGYGRINGLKAVRSIEGNQFFTGSVTTGNTNTHNLNVPANVRQLKVMVYWHDYPAAVNASVALVNNLNMQVIDPNTVVYNPWVLDYTPNATNLNSPATRAVDIRNNHEQVTIDNPVAGNYSITVNGATVPQGPQTYYVVYYMEMDGVTLTYPIGGEGFNPGENETIRWDAFGNSGTFSLDYSTDNGSSWSSITTSVPASQRYHIWTVPTALSGQCLVRVTRGASNDVSDANFSIIGVPTNIQVTWACPDSLRLTWNAVTGATGYDIFKLGNTYMDSIGTSTGTAFVVTNVPSNQTYWFSVRARGPQNAVGRRAIAIQKTPGTFNCPIAIDASVTSVVSPSGTLPTCQNLNNVQVARQVFNAGTGSLTNIPVRYRINNGPIVNETFSTTLASMATATYTFTTTANLSTPSNYIIKAWASYTSDGNVFNDSSQTTVVVATGTLVNAPITENFETFNLCGTASDCGTTICNLANGFINENSNIADEIDWRTDEGGTPSTGTGPSTDYIPGTATGNYVYLEASACFNRRAHLLSPCINLGSLSNPWLSFGYHMNGVDMGTLTVDVFSNGNWTNDVWTRTGNQGTAWLQGWVNLNAYSGQIINIRWRGTTGAKFTSDMALDGISVTNLTGVPNVTQGDGVVLFPNPSDGSFNLSISDLNNEDVRMVITDMSGRTVYTQDLGTLSGSLNTQIDLRGVSAGVYTLVLDRGGRLEYLKISKY